MLTSILIGMCLIGVTVALHAAGTAWWVGLMNRWTATGGAISWAKATRFLIQTTLFLFLLHVIEVVLWALTYLWLPSVEVLTTFEEAVYFSMVTFTTLGYGDITLEGKTRLLSGIQALNGVLLAGWSTALLFVAVQQIWFRPR